MIYGDAVLPVVLASAGSNGWKLTLAVAGIPAITAVIAATVAARSAYTSKRAEINAQRLRDLENRISEKKYEVYRPMLTLFQRIIDQERIPQEEFKRSVSDFSTWIIIYGSDVAVRAFHNFMQAAYNSPPPAILMKLAAEFILAARKDLNEAETEVTASHFLGMRITELFSVTGNYRV